MLTSSDTYSPRESMEIENIKEENRLGREYELTRLRLELDTRKAMKELEVKLQELRVAHVHEQQSAKRIPVLLLKILLFPFLGLAIVITTILPGQERLRALLEFLA